MRHIYKGFLRQDQNHQKGTWNFEIQDDMGTEHEIFQIGCLQLKRDNTCFHHSTGRSRAKDPDGTHCIIKHDKMIINGTGHIEKIGKPYKKSVDLSAHHLPIRNIANLLQQ